MEEKGEGNGSGFEKMGRGLILAVGWKCSRGPISYFSFSFFFSFSIF
jgi:hypothetical protein